MKPASGIFIRWISDDSRAACFPLLPAAPSARRSLRDATQRLPMKLFCILLLTLASFLLPARGQESKLAVYLYKCQGESILAFNGIDNDRPAISNLLGRVLRIDSGICASLFVHPDVEFHEFSDAVLFLKGIGFRNIEVIGFARQGEGWAIRFDACDVEDHSGEIPLEDLTPTESLVPAPPIEPVGASAPIQASPEEP